MIGTQLGKRDAASQRNPALAPHMKRLRRQPEAVGNNLFTDVVDQRAIYVLMRGHDQSIHAALTDASEQSLIEINGDNASTVNMGELADRLRQRLDELGWKPADAARKCGMSPQRFGNYLHAGRKPDIETLVRISRALRVSTDWLLGLSEAAPVDAQAVILRLLELDGMSRERAEVIAQAAEEALRLLASLPTEGDGRTRALLAAQAAWQMKPQPKPS